MLILIWMWVLSLMWISMLNVQYIYIYIYIYICSCLMSCLVLDASWFMFVLVRMRMFYSCEYQCGGEGHLGVPFSGHLSAVCFPRSTWRQQHERLFVSCHSWHLLPSLLSISIHSISIHSIPFDFRFIRIYALMYKFHSCNYSFIHSFIHLVIFNLFIQWLVR